MQLVAKRPTSKSDAQTNPAGVRGNLDTHRKGRGGKENTHTKKNN